MMTTTLYLLSGALSLLGNSVLAVALPLIILERTGSAAAAGTLALAVAVPTVLASLIGGVVIDRVDRRLASVVSDVISALSVAALPIVDRLAGLDLGWFIALGVVGAIGDAPGMAAREALLPGVVRAGGMSLERLISLRESVSALILVVGPGLAGILIAWLDGTTVLWLTAATSALAALTTALLPRTVASRVEPTEPRAGSTVLRDAIAGIAFLSRDRVLAATTVLSLFIVGVLGSIQGILLPVVFVARDQPTRLGTVLSAMAIGLLIGAVLFAVTHDRLAARRWFALSMTLVTATLVVIALQPPYWWLLAAAAGLGVSAGPVNAILGATQVRATPDDLRGRVNSTQTALAMIVAPLMIFGVSLVITHASLAAAGYLLAALAVASLAWSLLAPAFRALAEPELPG